jgi:transposase
MAVREYTKGFKEAMVKKLIGVEAKSAGALATEVGVPQSTLSRWVREYGSLEGRSAEGSMAKRMHQWGSEEKLRAVIEYEKLDEEARGKYLREKGLYSVDIQRWRAEMLAAVGKKPKDRNAQGQRIRQLEAELRRKDMALAETAALLVLKKKAQAIWGDLEDGK